MTDDSCSNRNISDGNITVKMLITTLSLCVCISDPGSGAGHEPVPYRPEQDFLPCGRARPPGGGERPEADRHHHPVPGPGPGHPRTQVTAALSAGNSMVNTQRIASQNCLWV